MREKRLAQFPVHYFNTIIVDEAHHCISDSYQRVPQSYFDQAKVLGRGLQLRLTGDLICGNLGHTFESLAYEYTPCPRAIKGRVPVSNKRPRLFH